MNWQLSPSENPTALWHLQRNSQWIEFIDSVDNLPNVRYQTVLIDLAKWDQYWQQDRCNFVPADLSDFPTECCASNSDYVAEIAMHQQKIKRWKTELASGSGKVPAVCFCETTVDGLLRIRQGRHRIVYLRQLGIPAFAAAIPRALLQDFTEQQLVFNH
jgi:hypothetical protein